jgi:hypothetical protein
LTSMQSPFLRPAKAASNLYNGVPYYIMRRISWVLVCSVGLLILCSGAAAKTRKGPRAIAVLEWEGDPKSPKPRTSVLVPITILDEGKYYDASIYRASPVPMAIDSGVVYDILKSGELVGTFVTGASTQQKNRWYGLGTFKAHSESNEPQVAKTSDIEVKEPEVGHPNIYVPGKKKDKKDKDQAPPPQPKPDDKPPDTSTADADPDRPRLKKGGSPTVFKEGNNEEVARVDNDPNRPKLRRPTQGEQKEAAGKSDPLAIFKSPELHTMVAVSDEYGAEPRSYAFQLKPDEEKSYRTALQKLATEDIAKYQKGLTKTVSLSDIAFRWFDLNGNNAPILIFSASSSDGRKRTYITEVARAEIDNNVRKLFSSITDTDHLDVYPRLELVDAVDADGDGRGDLLFRAHDDSGSRYVLYHAAPDSLNLLFDGARAIGGP